MSPAIAQKLPINLLIQMTTFLQGGDRLSPQYDYLLFGRHGYLNHLHGLDHCHDIPHICLARKERHYPVGDKRKASRF